MPKPLQQDRPIWPPVPTPGEPEVSQIDGPAAREDDPETAAAPGIDRVTVAPAHGSFEGFGSFST